MEKIMRLSWLGLVVLVACADTHVEQDELGGSFVDVPRVPVQAPDAGLQGMPEQPRQPAQVAPDASILNEPTPEGEDASLRAPEGSDAGVVQVEHDAANVGQADAGSVSSDAGFVSRDASIVSTDAGSAQTDSGVAQGDGGSQTDPTPTCEDLAPMDPTRTLWPAEGPIDCTMQAPCTGAQTPVSNLLLATPGPGQFCNQQVTVGLGKGYQYRIWGVGYELPKMVTQVDTCARVIRAGHCIVVKNFPSPQDRYRLPMEVGVPSAKSTLADPWVEIDVSLDPLGCDLGCGLLPR